MKKLLTITLLLLSNIAVFGDSIGYIDTQRIMSEYSAVKEFEITLEKQQEKYLKKVEESEKKIQKDDWGENQCSHNRCPAVLLYCS